MAVFRSENLPKSDPIQCTITLNDEATVQVISKNRYVEEVTDVMKAILLTDGFDRNRDYRQVSADAIV